METDSYCNGEQWDGRERTLSLFNYLNSGITITISIVIISLHQICQYQLNIYRIVT